MRDQPCIVMAMDDEDAVAQCQPHDVGPQHACVEDRLPQLQRFNRNGQLIHIKKPHKFRMFDPDLMRERQTCGSQRLAIPGRLLRLGPCPCDGFGYQRLKVHVWCPGPESNRYAACASGRF